MMTQPARPLHLLLDPLLWSAVAFLALVALMPATRPLFAWGFPQVQPPVFAIASFAELLLSHALIVAASSLASIVIGIGLGIAVTRSWGREFQPILAAIATIGQSFPPVAVLAVAVPAVGYGPAPTLIALAIYGLLPIIANTIAGLDGVPAPVREAATGMGLTPRQLLWRVELPLAAAIILAGVRISVIVNIGTAAIGSTVGALTLGTPIIDGLVSGKLPYVLQGGIIVALFAILTDRAFERVDRRLRRRPA